MQKNSSASLIDAERLFRSGQPAKAEALLRGFIAQDPKSARAHELLAYIRGNQGDLAGCEDSLRRAAALPGCSPEAFFYLGRVQLQLGNYGDAIVSLKRALELAGNFFEGLHELGVAYSSLGRHAEALEQFRLAEKIESRSPELQLNLADTLAALRNFPEAISRYDRALQMNPRLVQAWSNRGTVLTEMGNGADALKSYDKALAIQPRDVPTLMNRATTLALLKRWAEASECFKAVADIEPNVDYLPGHLLHAAMHVADWTDWEQRVARVESAVRNGERAATPFSLMGLPIGSKDLLACTRTFMADRYPPVVREEPAAPATSTGTAKRRIRVAYFSNDFREHATSQLIAKVFERHDHEAFEWFGFSLWPGEPDAASRRVAATMDHFHRVASRSDADIAKLARDAGIDIAIDLNALTEGMRPNIFAHRAAPIQVNYLGFPGSMGAPYMDYIVADRTLIRPDDYRHYCEKVVLLPDSYQPNDESKVIAELKATRADLGLPADGFVFACFNNTFKITPDVFDIWMRLLAASPGSVLWLLETSPDARKSLEAEAHRRGIDASRLVWAPRAALPDHLARHALADLFLDTFHYNAHTTASDALWAGLPLLTLCGQTFPSRVAASLLRAIDLPELITQDVREYEQLALQLARSPDRLHELRGKLARNRACTPLFDSTRLARSLETAYRMMWERRERGLAPDHIDVAQNA